VRVVIQADADGPPAALNDCELNDTPALSTTRTANPDSAGRFKIPSTSVYTHKL
jgi:hypothetical protein